jgi:hypothetical protein
MSRRLVIRRLLTGRSVRAYLAVGRSGPDPGLSLIIAQKRTKGFVCPPVRHGGRSQGRLPGERRPTGRSLSRPDTDGDRPGQKVAGTVTPAAGRPFALSPPHCPSHQADSDTCMTSSRRDPFGLAARPGPICIIRVRHDTQPSAGTAQTVINLERDRPSHSGSAWTARSLDIGAGLLEYNLLVPVGTVRT